MTIFGHGLNLAVRPWCAKDDYWPLYFDLNERVKAAFEEGGITIPFPQRDVHLHPEEAAKARAA